MNLGSLLLLIGTIAIVLTLISSMVIRGKKNWILQFLQYFSGTLFIISGLVKAVDPLGTAYKMEQYFAEFESTFSATWMSWISPIFPFLSGHSAGFAIAMIVLEILLGIMLVLGTWKKLTAWAFFLLVVFFTILTGFTFLTGYVPSGGNFFDFSSWGPYTISNMRVTDCGCFGDFIKLEPRVSFYKDLVLLIPAVYFLFVYRSIYSLLSETYGRQITLGLGGLVLVFCLYSTFWNLPVVDFRPFREQVNLRAQKIAEEDAQANVEITGWLLKHKETGEVKTVPNEEYMANLTTYRGTWEVVDQVKSEPAIPITKISDFEVSDQEGNDMTYDILDAEGYSFMIVSYHLPEESAEETTVILQDTIWATDTIIAAQDTQIVRRIEQIDQQTLQVQNIQWDPSFLDVFREKINPLLDQAVNDQIKSYLITSFSSPETLADFQEDSGFGHTIYLADDILLKTIIRSNPGIVLMKDGVILKKWHYRHLPSYDQIRSEWLN